MKVTFYEATVLGLELMQFMKRNSPKMLDSILTKLDVSDAYFDASIERLDQMTVRGELRILDDQEELAEMRRQDMDDLLGKEGKPDETNMA